MKTTNTRPFNGQLADSVINAMISDFEDQKAGSVREDHEWYDNMILMLNAYDVDNDEVRNEIANWVVHNILEHH